MSQLERLNTDKLLKDFYSFTNKETNKFNIREYYQPSYFLNHVLALFATVKLKRNSSGLISMKKTMDNTKDNETHAIPSVNVRQLVILVAEANRSLLMGRNTDSTLKSFTPIFMYAHKLYNGVEYSEWDKDDEYINYALGRTLYNMLVFAKANTKPSFDVMDMRTKCMTYKSGSLYGKTEKLTAYKMNPESKEYPSDILRMELQTWIANVEVRNEKSMILDIWDWSHIPTPFDAVFEKESNVVDL